MVHINDILTLFAELKGGFLFHIIDSVSRRKNICERKESRLQNGACTLAETDFRSQINSVDCVKLNIVFSNVTLCFGIHMVGKFFGRPLAVYKEYTARFYIVYHLITLSDV